MANLKALKTVELVGWLLLVAGLWLLVLVTTTNTRQPGKEQQDVHEENQITSGRNGSHGGSAGLADGQQPAAGT
jgi:hypothetical protein